ncbi:M60 family metallopeptidase [Paenibacillus sp. MBLB4367]|uniref:M60 family metallopeptidase n=1 Tax=Paenibacillus sp. MBLB4367 TaxID=3384767 RepID=UPI003907EEAA
MLIKPFKKWMISSLCLITLAASAGQTAVHAQQSATEAVTSDATLQNDLNVFYKDLTGIPTYSSSNSGGVSAIGEQAFNVAVSQPTTPNIAAARYGQGRVYLAGDDLYFKPSEQTDTDKMTIVRNSLQWLTADAKAVNPNAVTYDDALAGHGRLQMITTSPSSRFQVNSALPIDLKRIDSWSSAELDPARYPVAYVDFPVFQTSDDDIPYLEAYVRNGGSIAVAAKGWVLETYASNYLGDSYKGKTASLGVDYPIQRLLNKFGLGLMNNTATKTNGTLPAPTVEQAKGAHVLTLMGQAKAIEAGTLDLGQVKLGPPGADAKTKLTIMAAILGGTIGALTPASPLYAAVQSGIDDLSRLAFPLDKSKAPYSSALLAFVLNRVSQEASPAKSPFADHFPGIVPDNAPIVNRKPVEVNFDLPDFSYLRMAYPPGAWISTGLYAPAGKEIVIDVPAGTEDLDVQIGAHTDNLTSKDIWKRIPAVTKRQKLVPGLNKIQSAYGGLLYLIPTKAKPATKTTVTVSGGVSAPYYVSGQTSLEDWIGSIRSNPAPWAELQGRRAIVTVPSSLIRNLDDPKALMDKWDAIIDHYDELTGLSPEGALPHRSPVALPFRYVDDVQISAGSAHAGYPMMFDNYGTKLTDVANVTAKGWGIWHESGHEYQQNPWKWGAIVEVSVNIYSLYVQEKFGNASNLLSRDAQGKDSYDKAFAYLSSDFPGKTYGNTSQLDLFSELVLFKQLQLAYGWDFYTAMHTYYRDMPANQVPQNDQQKIDTFVVTASQLSGENLLSFFDKWAVPYTKDPIRAQVEAMHLPNPQTPVWTLKETNPLSPPAITLTPDTSGWSETDVTFTITDGATQTPSVPARSQYRIGDKGTWKDYTVPVAIDAEGETNVYARMIDQAGLTSEHALRTIRINRPIAFDQSEYRLYAGQSAQTAVRLIVNGSAIDVMANAVFQSQDASIASIGANGLLTGHQAGNTVITAAYGAKTASANVKVLVDSVPPVTTDDAKAGWHNAPQTVTLAASDGESGLAKTYYSLDGAPFAEGLTIAVESEGVHTIGYYSIDAAGNREADRAVTVRIDYTGPVIEGTVTQSVYQSDSLTVSIQATDPLSGVAYTAYEWDGKPVGSPAGISPLTLSAGTHLLRVTAADHAGNTSSKAFAVQVTVDADHLDEILHAGSGKGWISNHGILQSLLAKAANVQKQQDAKQLLNALRSLEHEVSAQAGKHIDAEFASLLLGDIAFLKASIE